MITHPMPHRIDFDYASALPAFSTGTSFVNDGAGLTMRIEVGTETEGSTELGVLHDYIYIKHHYQQPAVAKETIELLVMNGALY